MNDEPLTLKQAAAYSGLSTQALKKAAQRGVLNATLDQSAPRGPLWLTTRADVDRYVEQHARPMAGRGTAER